MRGSLFDCIRKAGDRQSIADILIPGLITEVYGGESHREGLLLGSLHAGTLATEYATCSRTSSLKLRATTRLDRCWASVIKRHVFYYLTAGQIIFGEEENMARRRWKKVVGTISLIILAL